MSLIVTYDPDGYGGGTDLTAAYGLPPSAISIPTRAENGDSGSGVLPFEDPAAALTLAGHKPVIVEEDECAQPRLFTGYVVERGFARSGEDGLIVGNDRLVEVNVYDQNAAAHFIIISGEDGNRPEESWNARLAWLVASDYLSPFIGGDTTYFGDYEQSMDAADYRKGYAASVLDDLSERTGGVLNWFLFWNPDTDSVELFIKREQYTTGTCTLKISNVESDVDGVTVFAPDMVAKLAREPDQVYSEVIVEYGDGQKVYRSRAATATAYTKRGATISRPYTKRESTAQSQADNWLTAHSVERDRISCVMRSVPAESVGLVRAGMGIDFKASHLPGYAADFVTMRIVMCSPVPVSDVGGALYDISLELLAAQPEPEVPEASSLISFIALRASSGYTAPTGWTLIEGHENGWKPKPPSYTDDYGYPIAFAAKPVGAPTWTTVVTSDHETTNGAVFESPEITVTEAGTIFGGFGYSTTSPNMIVSSPAVRLSEGLAYGDVPAGPYSWFGYIPVAGAGTYKFTLTRPSVPNLPFSYYGWICVFFPGTVEIVQSRTDTALGGGCYIYWDTPPPGEDPTPYWDSLNGSSRPRAHSAQLASSAQPPADDTEFLGPDPPPSPLHSTDPTVDDDSTAGYAAQDHWINVETGQVFINADATEGDASWVAAPSATMHAADPTEDDDETLGYVVGNVWLNTVTPELFVLTDATDGAAVWTSLADVPATTVESETSFGITPAVGSDTEYARQDHTHGSPANPVTVAALEALGVRGELLIADGTSGPEGITPTSYVEMTTPDTTTSATLEDLTGATTTITLQRTSHVAAWLNCHVSASASCDYGIAINFDGTDHDEIPTHLTATDEGGVAVVHRTATELPPGTYTVKGRHRRISGGGTPQTDRADLLVMAMGSSGPVLLTNEDEDDYLYANLA